MEAPDHGQSTISRLEKAIEKFIPKMFYDYNYTFKHGLTVYVPKEYIEYTKDHLRISPVVHYRVLDISER